MSQQSQNQLSKRFFTWVQEFFVFGDVKATALALAITSSLCCSIVWLVVSVISGSGRGRTNKHNAASPSSAHTSMMNFHLKKISAIQSKSNRKMKRQKSAPAASSLGNDCEVPCIRCNVNNSCKGCRYILCLKCCCNSPITCLYHRQFKFKTQKSVDTLQVDKPTEIDLSCLDLKSCPERLGYIGAHLVTLNLSCNKLVGLPQEIGFLRGLEELYLHQNSIKTLPESIGTLTKLKDLSLKRNLLCSLPSSIGCLEDLRFLDLQDNFLEGLPQSVGKLKNLEVLILEHNNLQAVPDEFCDLINLKIFSVAENNLSALPEMIGNLVRLQDLNVSDNILKHLPASICDCRALVKLLAASNSLTVLPGSIGRLHQLNELRVNDNQLSYLPASLYCLGFCVMNVKMNPFITELDTEKITSLTSNPPCCIPNLFELAARTVIEKHVSWKLETLPNCLSALLRTYQSCDSCEGVFFHHFKSQIDFYSLWNGGQKLPLYQHICSPNLSPNCQMLTIPSY
ncbi:uncharacterized protein LOC141914838 [Tubulanus polymorphus]|uniref:uncharacterized protein LOC141914838 n=1 Tax=Tubulanus polymorphus TaxID=672921 RepID=UPI003DA37551